MYCEKYQIRNRIDSLLQMDRRGSFKLHKIKMWMRRAHLTPIDRELLLHKCVTTGQCASRVNNLR